MKSAFTAFLLVVALLVPAGSTARRVLFAVDVARADRGTVSDVVGGPGVSWTVELGDVLVVEGTGEAFDYASRRLHAEILEGPRGGEALYVGRCVHPNEIPAAPGVRLLASSGTFTLLAATPEGASRFDEGDHATVAPLRRNVAYARPAGPVAARAADESLEFARRAAEAIDGDRWLQGVRELSTIRTRYSGTSGNLQARDYIRQQFLQIGLTVTTPRVVYGSTETFNVVGELPGLGDTGDIIIACGHLDTISEQPQALAPGAEDNATGAAGVVELARVFAENRPAATLRFIAFSGEEDGLFGSRAYAAALVASGEASRVKGVINMDMIGFNVTDDLAVLIETAPSGDFLFEPLQRSAAEFTSLRVVTSLNPFGSDHVPFIIEGIPAILTIDNDWDRYVPYHTSRDTIENVRKDMGVAVLRMNAGGIALLATAQEPPDDEPFVSAVRFKKGKGGRLVVDGRFAWETSRIQVNGQPLATTQFDPQYRDGATTRRVTGQDPQLKALLPKGVEVRVTVVDTATGLVTADFIFAR